MPVKKIFEQYGFHCFLLPVFFMLHSYLFYYGLVSGGTALHLLVKIELLFALFFAGLLLFTRHAGRSAQLTTLTGFLLLFFGVMKDFVDETLGWHPVARYAVFLPLLLLATAWAVVRIWKTKDFRKLHLFQNTTLLLFIVADLARWGTLDADSYLLRHLPVKQTGLNPDKLPVPANRPDVYFLVFDSYPGNDFLRNYLQYDNSPFNAELQKRGFHIIAHPKSNYNRTQFSIACTFNFEYLQNISQYTGARYYNQSILSIEHGIVPRVFMHCGYRIYNLSIFNLAGHPALRKENFLTLPETHMLLYNTLPERVRHDLLWHFGSLGRYIPSFTTGGRQPLMPERNLSIKEYNNIAIDSIPRLPASGTGDSPVFMYAHLYLPHIPLSYDSNGHVVTIPVRPRTPDEEKAAVLSYLKYTNKVILKLVDSLLQNSRRQPLIILQSDHGYRDLETSIAPPSRYFDNYSAFYFPDRNYGGLYDTMSNINTFPVVFNTFFNTHIPIQKDSSIYLPFP